MFGGMWLGIASLLGILLMVAAIVFITPLFLAVAICVVIVVGLFLLSRLGAAASSASDSGPSYSPAGAGSQTSGPDSGGRPVSGEGD